MLWQSNQKKYKNVKAGFRAKLRAFQREKMNFSAALKWTTNTSKLFRMIRKPNGSTTEPTSTLNYKGAHLYSGSFWCLGKLLRWSCISSKINNNDSTNFSFHRRIKEQYAKLIEYTSTGPESITILHVEVSEVIQSLKANKAAGADAIDPEHLIYDGESLTTHLIALFNAVIMAPCTHP